MEPKYVTCLNCIDGRTQIPVIKWITENHQVDYVDMITEPGMNGVLAEEKSNIDEILSKVDISRNVHNTIELFVVAHYDCAANPVSKETHLEHINTAVRRMKNLRPEFTITGLWVEDQTTVEVVVRLD
jgi:hypothetical protein